MVAARNGHEEHRLYDPATVNMEVRIRDLAWSSLPRIEIRGYAPAPTGGASSSPKKVYVWHDPGAGPPEISAWHPLSSGIEPTRDTALALYRFLRDRLARYQRIRRLEFTDLPKTISGKIRRVELRRTEDARHAAHERGAREFWEEDSPS
jgi:hypothetical protein